MNKILISTFLISFTILAVFFVLTIHKFYRPELIKQVESNTLPITVNLKVTQTVEINGRHVMYTGVVADSFSMAIQHQAASVNMYYPLDSDEIYFFDKTFVVQEIKRDNITFTYTPE